MQLSTNVSPDVIITWFAALASLALNWRFASALATTKLDIKTENDALRRELSSKIDELRREFVPGSLAQEQRSSTERRIVSCEDEIHKNRDRMHDLGNKFTELLLGKMTTFDNVLVDKARRLAAIEERLRGHDDVHRLLEDRIETVESRIETLDQNR